ncbi:O-antigen polysaccharide polymerase Wzy [Macrococcus equi]|uniref:O-antigen polysaccharide polymerase Wzy n=1 Tax=Macrococcus equi TaxID=3395462 RepID=UPI0039BEB443
MSLLFILLSAISLYLYYISEISFKIPTLIISASVLASLILLYKEQYGYLFSYLFYLFISHYGIFFVDVFESNPFIEYRGDLSWYYNNFKLLHINTSLFILGYLLISYILVIIKKENKINQSINEFGNKYFYYAGILLIVFFTILYLYYIFTGKLRIGNYLEYVDSLGEAKLYPYGIAALSIGIAFTFSNTNRKGIIKLILLLLVPLSLLLMTGNRGEVFYPLLASMAVLINRGIKIKKITASFLLFAFFILIPIIKFTRELEKVTISEININWYSSLVEIGYTLRPMGYVVNWISNGERMSLGMSYIAPFQRILSNFIPQMSEIDYHQVGYGFRYRLPGMGFSVIAESYYNLGYVGMLIACTIICLVCWKFNIVKTYKNLSIFTAIFSLMLGNIRNAFSTFPAAVIFVLFVSFVVLFWGNLNEKVKKR